MRAAVISTAAESGTNEAERRNLTQLSAPEPELCSAVLGHPIEIRPNSPETLFVNGDIYEQGHGPPSRQSPFLAMVAIDEYWASFFGLSAEAFLDNRLKVVPHAGLSGYRGAWLFRRGPSLLISVPPKMVNQIERKLWKTDPGALTDEAYIALFGDKVERVIAPAYQGYLEKHAFRAVASATRLLSPSDDEALRELAAGCDPQEWDHSSLAVGHEPNFGLFGGGKIVAASNCDIRSGGAGSPGLITHPLHRGRGYAKAVLSASSAFGLDNGLLMIYQTLMENTPSVAVAESLGYRRYAVHRAIRLN